jgi:hypothetical protein
LHGVIVGDDFDEGINERRDWEIRGFLFGLIL